MIPLLWYKRLPSTSEEASFWTWNALIGLWLNYTSTTTISCGATDVVVHRWVHIHFVRAGAGKYPLSAPEREPLKIPQPLKHLNKITFCVDNYVYWEMWLNHTFFGALIFFENVQNEDFGF